MANRKITVIQSTAKPITSIKPIIELDDGERIQVDRLLICSGSSPHRPASFSLYDSSVCTSDELWHWQDLPKSLMIVGEGVIACEFAFIFKTMGVEVTMLGMDDITRTVHAHPTLSEAVFEAAEDVFDQACHKPLKRQRTGQVSDVSTSKKSKSSC